MNPEQLAAYLEGVERDAIDTFVDCSTQWIESALLLAGLDAAAARLRAGEPGPFGPLDVMDAPSVRPTVERLCNDLAAAMRGRLDAIEQARRDAAPPETGGP